jgi:hypothetical protein
MATKKRIDKGTTYTDTTVAGVRLKTETTTVYQFDALSDSAKENARNWYRAGAAENFNDWSADNAIEDFARIADLFGLDIRTRAVRLMNNSTRQKPDVYYSGFSSQGDGASFTGYYHYKRGSARAIASECPSEWTDRETGERRTDKSNAELNRIVSELADLQRKYFYQLQALITRHSSHYVHEMTMDIVVERADEKAIADNDVDAVRECLRDFARWMYRSLEREYDYQLSDECVDDNIRANEYEFDENGNRA